MEGLAGGKRGHILILEPGLRAEKDTDVVKDFLVKRKKLQTFEMKVLSLGGEGICCSTSSSHGTCSAENDAFSAIHLFFETHVEETICLVQNEPLKTVSAEALGGLEVVQKSTGRAHKDRHSLPQTSFFALASLATRYATRHEPDERAHNASEDL